MKRIVILMLGCAAVALGWQSSLKLDHLDRLTAKATDSVNITLDASMLKLAAAFLSSDDDDDAADIKKLVQGLTGVYVRSFEFKNAGEYTDADIESIRAQLRDPSWKKIVEVRSKVDGDADIYIKTDTSKIGGLAIISAEPKELTIVNIEGTIDVEGVKKLGGNFGIPKFVKKLEEKKPEDKK
jgi:predicted alpha-1,6-mannanase (GH76 family)